jgi:hypothetical protein
LHYEARRLAQGIGATEKKSPVCRQGIDGRNLIAQLARRGLVCLYRLLVLGLAILRLVVLLEFLSLPVVAARVWKVASRFGIARRT